jgi:hypothetical protein
MKTYEYVDVFQLVLIFPCNLTRYRFGDFDMIFVTHFLKSNKNYI